VETDESELFLLQKYFVGNLLINLPAISLSFEHRDETSLWLLLERVWSLAAWLLGLSAVSRVSRP